MIDGQVDVSHRIQLARVDIVCFDDIGSLNGLNASMSALVLPDVAMELTSRRTWWMVLPPEPNGSRPSMAFVQARKKHTTEYAEL